MRKGFSDLNRFVTTLNSTINFLKWSFEDLTLSYKSTKLCDYDKTKDDNGFSLSQLYDFNETYENQ